MTDILSILHEIGYTNLTDCGHEWSTRAIYRDGDNNTAISINKTTGFWFDFVERKGGTLAQLVQITLKLPSLSDSAAYLKDLPISIYNGECTELTETKKFDKTLLLKLIKDNSYWNSRGVSNATLDVFGGGVAVKNRMNGRYVFPIWEGDDLIGLSGRSITDADIRWKHLGVKSSWVFPQFTQYIKQNNSVLLVESIGDFLQLFDNGIKNVIVLFGVNLSTKIIQHLLKLDVGKIIIATNNDFENNFVGNRAAEDIKEELLNYFDESQVVIALPPKNDFGMMTSAEILEYKEKYL